MKTLLNRTILITGASRGIGREMALKFASEGANIVIAAKSAEPHPKLQGTIHSVAAEVEAAGGKALAVQVDVRSEEQVQNMVTTAIEKFGNLDVLINNAGAIKLAGVEHTPLKSYDLMQQINARAVFLCSQAALPHLKKSEQAHIINLSPPLNLNPRWFTQHAPYTISKYGMTMLTLGMAGEFAPYGIAVNALWPRTLIATAAIEFELGGKEHFAMGRLPSIMADAAYALIQTRKLEVNGQALIDEDFLRSQGQTDFDHYAYQPGTKNFFPDLFLDSE